MKRQRRQQRLLELLAAGDIYSVTTLADALTVSEETVRREIRALEAEGQVVRSHGAVRLARVETEGSFAARLQRHAEAKRRIAAAAARFVADGQTLYIDASTTGHYVAQALADRRGLTVVTNAVGVARELAGRNGHRVLLAGGELDYDYQACFDHQAIDYLSRFTPSLAILSVQAVHLDHGFASYHHGEATVCRLMVERSRRVMMAVDSSKLDRGGTIMVAPFAAVDIAVTEQAPPQDYVTALARGEWVVG
jgi:DeoR family glycerol-3-phosphate regulon repressor